MISSEVEQLFYTEKVVGAIPTLSTRVVSLMVKQLPFKENTVGSIPAQPTKEGSHNGIATACYAVGGKPLCRFKSYTFRTPL